MKIKNLLKIFQNPTGRIRKTLTMGTGILFLCGSIFAEPEFIGDIDDEKDGATIFDLIQLINHVNTTSPLPQDIINFGGINFADINQDSVINQDDIDLLGRLIVTRSALQKPVSAPTVVQPPSSTNLAEFTFTGKAKPNTQIRVDLGGNSFTYTVDASGDFEAKEVPLLQNRLNRLFFTDIDNGQQSAPRPVFIVHDSQPPQVFADFPSNGSLVASETSVIAGRVSDLLSGFLGLFVKVVNTSVETPEPGYDPGNSQLANVIVGIGTNGTFERGNVPLAVGPNVIQISAIDIHGNEITKTITITRENPDGVKILSLSGNLQKGKVNSRLADPLVVELVNVDGTPIPNKIVSFDVTRSDGRLNEDQNSLDPGSMMIQVRTDDRGQASLFWTLGSDAGCGNNRVEVTTMGVARSAFFCASADASPPSQINIGSGNNQIGQVGEPITEPLRIWVNDSCNGVAGIPVTFTVIEGGGKVNNSDSVTVPTGITGHAEVSFISGPTPGNNIVSANFPENPGLPATFTLRGISADASQTSFVGLVLDNAGKPISNAEVTLEIGGTSFPSTTSGDDGRFALTNISPGAGILHVVPQGSFPGLEFEVVVIENAENSLPMPVLLPVLDPANERQYSTTTDTILEVAGMDGLQMIVKAGSMFNHDGTPATDGTAISLNQVHHDDIPMPMPDGAAPPFAWTLQPAGATFDPPIEIRYPNMTGLPPGSIAYFLSFNHDTNRFEIISSGSVSDDGSVITTDPGSGLSLAGWGCNCPPYAVTGDCEGPDCTTTCQDKGRLNKGQAKYQGDKLEVCAGSTISWSITAQATVTDGKKRTVCGDEPPINETITGRTVSYTWKITGPGGTIEGSGPTASTSQTMMGGEYTCTFTAKSSGPCPPNDKDFTAQGKFTVIEIKEITFDSEDPLPAQAGAMLQPSVEICPATSSNIVWSIEGDDLGVMIDTMTGKLTATQATVGQEGQIRIKATLEDEGCFKTATVCVGGTGENCCEDLQGTVSFGPISFMIPGIAVSSDQVDGFCCYRVDAALSIGMTGVFQKTAALEGVSISWKQKGSEFKDVTIEWKGKKDLGQFGIIKGAITQASLTVDSQGKLSGMLTFSVENTEEVNIAGWDIAFLQPGVTGIFTYTFMASSTFDGMWNFQEIQNIEVHVKKGTKKIAEMTSTGIDANGNVMNARFAAEPGVTYETSAFNVTLDQLDLMLSSFNIDGSNIVFAGGNGAVTIKDIKNVKGTVKLALNFMPSLVDAVVTLEMVEAFGSTISGMVTTSFDYNFDLKMIVGSDISAKHNDFEQSFTGVGFEIKEGELEKFSIGQIEAKYKNTLTFSMKNAEYNKSEAKLGFDAEIALPTIMMSVESFKINVSDGSVTVGKLSATVNKTPVLVEVNISFMDTQFMGEFRGRFGSTIDISGTITIGATPTYNYGHFTLRVQVSSGVPIGNSGLKVVALSGEFGFNWSAPLDPTGTGMPEEGSIVIGFGMGISDVAGIVLIDGNVRLNLGSQTFIQLEGAVKVTASPPHYVTGMMTITYELGKPEISGSFNSTLKIPPSSGNVVDLNSGNVTFGIKNRRWSVDGTGINGTLFNAADITNTGIAMNASLTNIFSLRGNASANISYSEMFSWVWPSGFNSSSCSAADATDSLGFGADVEINIMLSGSISAALRNTGLSGSVSVNASGDGTANVKLPCLFCGDDCVSNFAASISGTLRISQSGAGFNVSGNVRLEAGSFDRQIGVDFTI